MKRSHLLNLAFCALMLAPAASAQSPAPTCTTTAKHHCKIIINGKEVTPQAEQQIIQNGNTTIIVSRYHYDAAATPTPQPQQAPIARPEPVKVIRPEHVDVVRPAHVPVVRPEPVKVIRPEHVDVIRPAHVPVVRPEPVKVIRPKHVDVVRPAHVPVVRPQTPPATDTKPAEPNTPVLPTPALDAQPTPQAPVQSPVIFIENGKVISVKPGNNVNISIEQDGSRVVTPQN